MEKALNDFIAAVNALAEVESIVVDAFVKNGFTREEALKFATVDFTAKMNGFGVGGIGSKEDR